METTSFKALSVKHLQGNHQGNHKETLSFHRETSEETTRGNGGAPALPVPPPNEGRNLSHYCGQGNCWCSEKLPGSNYPSGCVGCNCEQDAPILAPQQPNEQQGILALA